MPDDKVASTFDFKINALFSLEYAHSIQDVASALGMKPSYLFYVVQHADDGTYYRSFQIPKKRGGYRNIAAPQRGLGLAQSRLAAILEEKSNRKPYVMGYTKGRSFLENARYHEKQQWILNIDIEDFYPSITFPRVRGLFMSNLFNFNDRVSTILARLTTYNNQLPQGARTSPIIANLVANNLDRRLIEIASANRLKYTRYADDITFSSSRREVPASLVRGWEPLNGERSVDLSAQLNAAFKSSGFSINNQKTRISFKRERQEVTGLVVNSRANIQRRDISRLRMVLHSARKFGASEAAKLWIGAEAKPEHFWNFLCGWLSYVRQVRGKDDSVLAKLCKMAVVSGMAGPEWVLRSADMVREFDVFLSHASEDKPKIRKLKNKLDSLGVSVFFDEASIAWGDSITAKINHGLLKSSFFIPFLSESFARKGWPNKELNSAIAANVNRAGRILPIKDFGFSVDENYPLLNETLYKEWPGPEHEDAFVDELADLILQKVEAEKRKPHDLG
ncbi:TIR domain-containing anti-phage reverse transcriptase [Paracoccus benzoatiresistens]|uniref:RNA-directed DNA polymerase n=1 Tax=Paracoccus benzoatiresistens TaxID=2997341 RepID=A0ABT4JBJ4_9RHOB|nr:TIR domain-containing anti-phage reverse transcriptase [Paracoccus sp. EF6]MCZ0964435.1 reverse transcriptase domain-containing protein [Paracoccus sp. EF6]